MPTDAIATLTALYDSACTLLHTLQHCTFRIWVGPGPAHPEPTLADPGRPIWARRPPDAWRRSTANGSTAPCRLRTRCSAAERASASISCSPCRRHCIQWRTMVAESLPFRAKRGTATAASRLARARRTGAVRKGRSRASRGYAGDLRSPTGWPAAPPGPRPGGIPQNMSHRRTCGTTRVKNMGRDFAPKGLRICPRIMEGLEEGHSPHGSPRGRFLGHSPTYTKAVRAMGPVNPPTPLPFLARSRPPARRWAPR